MNEVIHLVCAKCARHMEWEPFFANSMIEKRPACSYTCVRAIAKSEPITMGITA